LTCSRCKAFSRSPCFFFLCRSSQIFFFRGTAGYATLEQNKGKGMTAEDFETKVVVFFNFISQLKGISHPAKRHGGQMLVCFPSSLLQYKGEEEKRVKQKRER
jgi:hypothetical protein